MRYVITYFNITKKKRYYYVIVILNIGLYLICSIVATTPSYGDDALIIQLGKNEFNS